MGWNRVNIQISHLNCHNCCRFLVFFKLFFILLIKCTHPGQCDHHVGAAQLISIIMNQLNEHGKSFSSNFSEVGFLILALLLAERRHHTFNVTTNLRVNVLGLFEIGHSTHLSTPPRLQLEGSPMPVRIEFRDTKCFHSRTLEINVLNR